MHWIRDRVGYPYIKKKKKTLPNASSPNPVGEMSELIAECGRQTVFSPAQNWGRKCTLQDSYVDLLVFSGSCEQVRENMH